mgnify:CR=1 FL=1
MENVLLILSGSQKRKKFSTYYITLKCQISGKFVIYGTSTVRINLVFKVAVLALVYIVVDFIYYPKKGGYKY